MKFKLHGVVFSLLFALGLVFSFGIEADGSHGDGEGIKAEDVNPGNQKQMEMFLDHIVDHYNVDVRNKDFGGDANRRARALTLYARDMRRSETYNHEDVYGIIVNYQTKFVMNHAKYPGLLAYEFDPDAQNSDVAGVLKALLDNSALGMTNCERYGQNDERVACAARVEPQVVVVVGLHHAEGDDLFVPPDCRSFGFELQTSAEDVFADPTEANLKAYVKGVIGVTQKGIQDDTTAIINEDPSAALKALTDPAARTAFNKKLTLRFSQRVACYGLGDFKYKNIYIFIMTTDPAGTVLLNGGNPDLNGLTLEVKDVNLPGDDKSIVGLFRAKLTGGSREPKAGDSATVNYRWHDPLDPDDSLENWFERGLVPGSSPKKSYIEVADQYEGYTIPGTDQSITPQLLIFGSGIYPDVANVPDMIDDTMEEDGGDGGGCAVAGTSNAFQGALLNLFLIASVLFSVVFLRRRV